MEGERRTGAELAYRSEQGFLGLDVIVQFEPALGAARRWLSGGSSCFIIDMVTMINYEGQPKDIWA
jgi:hypothetical protein